MLRTRRAAASGLAGAEEQQHSGCLAGTDCSVPRQPRRESVGRGGSRCGPGGRAHGRVRSAAACIAEPRRLCRQASSSADFPRGSSSPERSQRQPQIPVACSRRRRRRSSCVRARVILRACTSGAAQRTARCGGAGRARPAAQGKQATAQREQCGCLVCVFSPGITAYRLPNLFSQ